MVTLVRARNLSEADTIVSRLRAAQIFDADAAGECKRVRVRSGASASRHQEARELLESGEFGAVA